MKGFRFLAKLVLVLLLAGMATMFFESSFVSPAQGRPPLASPRKDVSLGFKTDLEVVAAQCIHSILSFVCAAPACAGDLEGDVQGD